MTQIATDLRNTIDNARRIRFEPSAAYPATNVQDAIQNFAGGFLPGLTTPTVITATGAVSAASVVVQTNQSASMTVTLPGAAAWAAANSKYGIPLSIFDISGAASTNNVTINPAGADTLSGLSSLTIDTDYGGYRLEPTASGWVVV